MAKFDDKTGKKFNMLTVKKYLGNSKWLCDCDCGTKDVIASSALLNEIPGRRKKKSCGCLLVKNVPGKEDFFESIDTPEKAYILGLIAADGAVQPELKRIKIDLKDVDEDILIKIQKQIGHTNKLSHYVNKDRTFRDNPKKYDCRISRLVITSEKMVEDVMKLGLVPNKSNTLDVKLNLIPQEFFFDFIYAESQVFNNIRPNCCLFVVLFCNRGKAGIGIIKAIAVKAGQNPKDKRQQQEHPRVNIRESERVL